MIVDVTTTYLEMTSPEDLRPKALPGGQVVVVKSEVPCPEFSRFLFTAVGGDWSWTSRLDWSYNRWLAWLDRPEVETWVLWRDGTPGGFVELEVQPGTRLEVEVAFFGLLPWCLGQGLGGPLLSSGVARAWALGAERVWLHTCDRDHPSALSNYLARGFRVCDVVTKAEEQPDIPPGPWPGARNQ